MIAILIAASSLAGLAEVGTRYGSDPPSVLVSCGGDAANVVVVVPILLATVWLTRRRSLPGLLLWPGALFYALYVYAIYLVAAPFTALLFGYVAIVTLSAATLGAVITSIDHPACRDRLAHTPARSVGAALVVVAVLAYAGLAATAVTAPGGATEDLAFRGQWAVDTALGTPVLLLGGVLLCGERPSGTQPAPACCSYPGWAGWRSPPPPRSTGG